MPPDRKSTHRLQYAWLLIQIGIAVYGLSVTAYLLARVGFGERVWLVAMCNNCVPWLVWMGLGAGGIALFSQHRRRLIALQIPGVVAFALLYGDLFWPHDPVAPVNGGLELTVATYNILSIHTDPRRITQAIDALDADIIGLQELGPDHAATFEREMVGDYPYQALHPSPFGFGIGLLSRYPIQDETVLLTYPKHERRVLMRAVLDVQGTRVTVYVAHPIVPFPLKNQPWQRVMPGTLWFPSLYDDNERDRQIGVLSDHIRQDEGPVLVLCDCNMSDQSDAYRALDTALDDAFHERGWGMGFSSTRFMSTHRVLPLFARIDYVWHSEHFTALDATVGATSGGSDHRPVVAELVLKPGVPANAPDLMSRPN